MKWIWSHPLLSAILLLLAVAGVTATLSGQNREPDWITTTVERGTVREIISVSGVVEAINHAELSFPLTGVVSEVLVARGDTVAAGELMATIGNEAAVAERAQVAAALTSAIAARDELRNGQTEEQAAVTETTLTNAIKALERTQTLARTQVANALASLLSNDLEAVAVDPEERATAPTVSGTYTCGEEGVYHIRVYASDTQSGYSFTLSGLEGGTYSATTEQPGPLGDCGLTIQFDPDDFYNQSEWSVTVPNPRSPTYVTRRNAYTLALAQAEENVQAARDAVALAREQATVATAAPRVEALIAANAAVQEAQARLQRIDARLAEYAILAPFAGIVTRVDLQVGEVAGATPAIEILNTDAFELVARIPEIDVTKLAVGQPVRAVFDAAAEQPLTGQIRYISPNASNIDGVGYFQAVIDFDTVPDWMRAGLNADIDIEIARKDDVPRLPQRFIDRDGDAATVRTVSGARAQSQPVTLGLIGNDGYIEVTDLPVGTTVTTP